MIKKITPELLKEARKMQRAWIESSENIEIERMQREIASIVGVSYHALAKQI